MKLRQDGHSGAYVASQLRVSRHEALRFEFDSIRIAQDAYRKAKDESDPSALIVSDALGVDVPVAGLLIDVYRFKETDVVLNKQEFGYRRGESHRKIFGMSNSLEMMLGFTKHFSKKQLRELSNYVQNMFVAAPEVARTFHVTYTAASRELNRLTNMTHGERFRYWAKEYAQQGRPLSELWHLLELSTPWYLRKILNKADIHFIDDMHYMHENPALVLARNKIDESRAREEIDMIIDGRSVTELKTTFGYSRARAEQRIQELCLYSTWVKARQLRKQSLQKLKQFVQSREILTIETMPEQLRLTA